MNSEEFILDGISDVWKAGSSRGTFVQEVARELSKTGSLEAFDMHLRELSKTISIEDVIFLYSELCNSRRPEFEWRSEFIDIFYQVPEDCLPQMTVSEGDYFRKLDPLEQSILPNDNSDGIPF